MSEYFRKPIVKTLMLKGQEGQSIKGIEKTGTDVLVDTYTITLTDGTTSTFTVTNGKGISSLEKTEKRGLVDTYTIKFNDGTNSTFTVTNGKEILSIDKTGTDVLVDTYTIEFNDGTTSTFTVTNGKGISNISKTGTSGLVDTYTIEFNDGTTSTFTVTNGDSAYKPAVEALGKRIDNLILSSGTESSAEVVDARNGYDGTTYDTLGTAIRSQVSELKEDLGNKQNLNTDAKTNLVSAINEVNDRFLAPVDDAVKDWLDEHPEATTTVQDKSLSIDKMIVGTLGYVTPEMFGAVGDGVTDDVEPLETALNYSITNHLELVLSKKYIVSRGIEIREKNGIRIVGNAFGYYFDYETLPEIKCSESFNDDFLIKFDGCSDISIKGINFVGCAPNRVICIFIKNSSFSLIEDNNIIKFRKGIYLYYSGLNKIIRNTISICYCACYAIGSGDSQYTDNYINSCSYTDEPDDPEVSTGIAIRASSNHVNITGGKIEWNGKGIYIDGSSGINITSINFDYNKRGNIIINGNSIDPDFTETVGLNINSNYFRSGGVEGKESHIYFETNKGNIKANICGNTFVKASGNNTSDLTICPTAIIRHSSNTSSQYKLNINVTGNMMLDGSTLNTFWLDGVNGVVNSHSNMTNLINYVINNELLVESSNLRKTVLSQNVDLTFNSDNNIYIGSLNVDISNYKNGVVIPLGAVFQDDYRFCDYYVSYYNGTIHIMSAKHNTARVSYCILYEQ